MDFLSVLAHHIHVLRMRPTHALLPNTHAIERQILTAFKRLVGRSFACFPIVVTYFVDSCTLTAQLHCRRCLSYILQYRFICGTVPYAVAPTKNSLGGYLLATTVS